MITNHPLVLLQQKIPIYCDSIFTPTIEFVFCIKKIRCQEICWSNGLSVEVFKEISAKITIPLTKLFNKSLETGVFPKDFKHCNVIPV